jgi:hypothetical protein
MDWPTRKRKGPKGIPWGLAKGKTWLPSTVSSEGGKQHEDETQKADT